MTGQNTVVLLLLVALLAANLPWLNERVFALVPLRSGSKPFWLRLAEWVLGFVLVALLAWRLELGCQISVSAFLGLAECPGELHPKSWEFLTVVIVLYACLLYTSPSPRDRTRSRMPSSA